MPPSTHKLEPLSVTASVVAEPLTILPLIVLALVFVPLSVRTVVPAAPPLIWPPKSRVPAPAPVPLALLLANVYVPPAPSITSGALIVSTAFVAVSVPRIWIVPPLVSKSELPLVEPMK